MSIFGSIRSKRPRATPRHAGRVRHVAKKSMYTTLRKGKKRKK